MNSLQLKIWGLRLLAVASLFGLCWLCDSSNPALAFAIAWGPNGLFLFAFQKGKLNLPGFLKRVHKLEPIIYRWLGVGFIKRLVANRLWPMVIGTELPSKPQNRDDFFQQINRSTACAENCHSASFLLTLAIAMACVTFGNHSLAIWTIAFSLLLNAYPIMLQRTNRWRVQSALSRYS